MRKLIIVLVLVITFISGCWWISDEEAEKAKQDFDKFPQKTLTP